MGVYLITIIFMVLFCWLADRTLVKGFVRDLSRQEQLVRAQKERKNVVFLIFILLAFVAAFRYKVGTDFHAYYRTQIWTSKFQEGDFNEFGFTVFANIASFLFQGRNGAVTILSAIITVALFVFTIAKRSDNLTVSMLLFIFVGCFTGLFNGVRQYLATAILFSGFHFVQEKKFAKWLLVVLLASTFHSTAILMVFIYFACNVKSNGITILIYCAIAFILLYFYENIFELINFIKQEDVNFDTAYANRQVNIFRVLVQCVPLVMIPIVGANKINEDNETRVLFNVCLLNAALAIASMNSVYLARINIYTLCFQILMYPKVLKKASQTNKIVFTTLLLTFYFAFWFYEVWISSNLNNFQWIFNYL